MHFLCKVYSDTSQEVPQMRLLRGSATVVTRQANEDEIKEATSIKERQICQWP